MKNQRLFPIVEYAHKIGKNTAEFTANDLTNFMRWWMKQPLRKDLIMKNSKGGFEAFQQKKHGAVPVDVEQVDESEVEELTEQHEEEQEIIAQVGLTRDDVQALQWCLGEMLETYDFHEYSKIGESLTNLKEALDGVELE